MSHLEVIVVTASPSAAAYFLNREVAYESSGSKRENRSKEHLVCN